MLLKIADERDRIDPGTFVQHVRWVPDARASRGPLLIGPDRDR